MDFKGRGGRGVRRGWDGMDEFEIIGAGLEGKKTAPDNAGKPGNPPQFSVKAKDHEGFVGSAWLNDGKYGKYISVKLREDAPKGTTLYLSPTKANPGLLG